MSRPATYEDIMELQRATREDIMELQRATRDDIVQMQQKIREVAREDIHLLRHVIVAEISQTKVELKGEIRQLNDEFQLMLQATKTSFAEIDEKMATMEAKMVTKEYLNAILDEKLGDLRKDLLLIDRKQDIKTEALVDTLHERKMLSDNDRTRINSLSPFAR